MTIQDAYSKSLIKTSNLITPIIIGTNSSSSNTGLQVMTDRNLINRLERILSLNIDKIIIFGVPPLHDSNGTQALEKKGVVQSSLKIIRDSFDKKIQVIADVCICQYNLSGHCGIVNQNNYPDNDKTLKLMSKIALSYAESGADTLAPSSMMDGLVLSIRNKLNLNGYRETKIMSFSKQFSSLYSPFRLTAYMKVSKIDKSNYQIGYANSREILRKVELDYGEGADVITIKPSMANLDIISRIRERVRCRIAVQHVSGEYAMLKAASRNNLINEYDWLLGYFACLVRAGADFIITYEAEGIAELLSAQ
ncbi:MAG: porphobilinogen synthase [Nitrososphaeraceae archaeon]